MVNSDTVKFYNNPSKNFKINKVKKIITFLPLQKTTKVYLYLLSLVFIISCSSEKNKLWVENYIDTWYNPKNFCDSLVLTQRNGKIQADFAGKKYRTEINKGYLDIYRAKKTEAILNSKNELLIDGIQYNRKLTIFNEVNLNGEWSVYECNTRFAGSFNINDESISIYFASLISINGLLEEESKNSYNIYYSSSNLSSSLISILGISIHEIEKNEPIGKIKIITKNLIEFEWYGIKIKDKNDRWLEYRMDEVFWGKNPYDEIKLVREY